MTNASPHAAPQTLPQKVWDRHVVHRAEGEPDLLYIDLHLVHEVTSPQAFDGLRLSGRGVRRPDLTVATEDARLFGAVRFGRARLIDNVGVTPSSTDTDPGPRRP